ncbi:hypothetical protein A3J90_01180 [candidate division WOR-1 bacterium RIFOXYC2_FULL_37_10]|uniref:Uncharacterized protein n=1 Tax=candidate division WOR-1 bacterium RIFOXYB2_FULL_37_13 TaxID=1802579 RepID=A0A1F4SSW6_UNCSA|nr:MAG: hypothetical protein A2246_05480 [candidate division WOR-1 bacterium RIFOXYA2_FULL_37_7]OGC23521.1 MAG: hypothetical protein A2310_02845 [candidate division WOR-1 bacterium RIFOXYB2_FULL_37_13]OGC35734.1 MAG: hypothetical protein A3J90_01180 [candidate division WOR-1 bacterium RIFOXYC2_FULL_37_10]
MENQANVIQYISNHLVTDYVDKLIKVKFSKVVLFTTFPITGAPNISDPRYFAKILNPEVLSDLLRWNIN